MLKVEIKDKKIAQIECTSNPVETANDVLNVICGIYGNLFVRDTVAALIFRTIVTTALNESSTVWKDRPNPGDVCMVLPVREDEKEA